jgi:hypothetical protein
VALAGKGSRLIVVEGVRYRYKVSIGLHVTIVAQSLMSPGQRLAASLAASEDCDPIKWAIKHLVIPGLVRHVILQGLAAGWRPTIPGKECAILVKDWKPFTVPTVDRDRPA